MVQRSDWTLLSLVVAGIEGLSPVQLQKILFLLGQAHPRAVGRDFYAFEPYNYGPFSPHVYADAERLQGEGLVLIENPGHTWARRYRATEEGREYAAALWPAVPPAVADYLGRVVPWAQQLPFQTLVRAIYKAYPEQRANSVFRDS